MPTTEMRFFWIKSDGRVQELSWEEYRDIYIKDWTNPIHKRLLARCDQKWITLIKGKNVITAPIKALDQITQLVIFNIQVSPNQQNKQGED